MSFIARCPACLTWYKVVPDQLRISDGWVRCGTCGEVFDVSRQLSEAESELPTDKAPTDAPEFPHPRVVSDPDARPDESSDVSWDSSALLIKPSMETEPETGPQSRDQPEPEVAEPVVVAGVPVPLAEPVSFMRAPVVGPNTHRPGMRVLWGVLSVFLLLGLLVQGIYRERDQLAALKPEFKPALQIFCEVLGCRLSPMQRIEALVLDSVTFHQMDPETFRLHLVVKNKTQLALAMPAVELTLTDLADQPVMRRVFLPAELGAKSDAVSAFGEWSATANLRVKADTAQPRALGYRLLVFYP